MKNGKKWIAGLTGAMLLSVCSVGMIPAAAQETANNTVNQQEQHQEWKAKQQAAKEKWDALSDEEKAELFAVLDGRVTADEAIIDKLVELEVLDREDAAIMKQHLREAAEKRQESGEYPFGRPSRRQHKSHD